MKDNIHQIHAGYDALADLLADENIQSRIAKQKYTLREFNNEVDRLELKPKEERLKYFPKDRPKYPWHFVAIYIVSIAGLYFFMAPRPAPIALPSFLNPEVEKEVVPEGQNVDHEITLIKEVLTDLTLTVEKLSKQKDAKAVVEVKEEEFKPSLITVISPKANLRESPSKDAKTLAVVERDTTLMGVGYQDGWIKTYAPSGKEAWVSSSLISRLEE